MLSDADLLPVYALLWAASLARLAGAGFRPEGSPVELTLAALALVGLPYLLRGVLRDWMARKGLIKKAPRA